VICLQVFESRQQQQTVLMSIRPGRLWGPTDGLSGSLSLGLKRPGREDKHSIHLPPRTMSGAMPPLLYMPSWCVQIYCFTVLEPKHKLKANGSVFEVKKVIVFSHRHRKYFNTWRHFTIQQNILSQYRKEIMIHKIFGTTVAMAAGGSQHNNRGSHRHKDW
jgi:hypothetical protein